MVCLVGGWVVCQELESLLGPMREGMDLTALHMHGKPFSLLIDCPDLVIVSDTVVFQVGRGAGRQAGRCVTGKGRERASE